MNARRYKKNEQGQALIIAILLFLSVSLILVFGIISPVVREIKITRDVLSSRQAFLLAEAGIEDAVYRIKNGRNISNFETLSLNGSSVTTTISVIGTNQQEVTAEGNWDERIRKVKTTLKLTTAQADFSFGVQTEEGGFVMENSSSIDGNLYSNGTVIGSGSSFISGDVVSAGPSGLIQGVEAYGDAYAHTIESSQIDGDAYYVNISGTTVAGTEYPGSPDLATSSLPLSDDEIDLMKAEAEAGGVVSSPCPYVIDTDTTLGPVKITCDLVINGDPIVNIKGVVWVEGNIDINNTAVVKLDPSFDDLSSGFIADNEADRITSSKIRLNNSVVFQGSGQPDTYIILVSQNNDAELGGNEKAIETNNTISGEFLLYAGHGEILLRNNTDLRQVTAYRIRLRNTTVVSYETGLASFLFSGGPGGGWEIIDWEEIE